MYLQGMLKNIKTKIVFDKTQLNNETLIFF